jgi:opacity protein-like surface antigen
MPIRSARIALIVAVVVMLAGAAIAQTTGYRPPLRAERWEFSVRTLYTGESSFEGEGGSSLDLEDSLGWGFGMTYHLDERFQVGLELSWRSIGYEAIVTDRDDPGEFERYASELDISTVAVTGAWNVLRSRVTPYVNGALGATLIDSNVLAGWGYTCWYDPWWGLVCGSGPLSYSETVTSANLGAGVRAELSDRVFGRLGYELGWLSSSEVDATHMGRLEFGVLF